jgi:uncharacterized protein (TIGR04255 family)
MIKPSKTKLPCTLGKCPIVDSVVEFRFSTSIYRQAIFGIAYEKLKLQYPKVEAQPILQFPQILIDTDPNLKFKAHYKLIGPKFGVNIGPDVISIFPIQSIPYPGWNEFARAINEVVQLLQDARIIERVLRLGIRYTNFFEGVDIYKKSNFSMLYNGNMISYKNTLIRTDIDYDGFTTTIQMSNFSAREIDGQKPIIGSIFDLDTFKDYPTGEVVSKVISEEMHLAHKVEKQLFWDLLNDDLKNDLEPRF